MVFEALAVGAVPVVVDFVYSGQIWFIQRLGTKRPLQTKEEVVLQIERYLGGSRWKSAPS